MMCSFNVIYGFNWTHLNLDLTFRQPNIFNKFQLAFRRRQLQERTGRINFGGNETTLRSCCPQFESCNDPSRVCPGAFLPNQPASSSPKEFRQGAIGTQTCLL